MENKQTLLRHLCAFFTSLAFLSSLSGQVNPDVIAALDQGMGVFAEDFGTKSTAFDKLGSDGKFSDLSYDFQDKSELFAHLGRVFDCAIHYRALSNPDQDKYDKIYEALSVVNVALGNSNNYCGGSNWNDWALGVPERVNRIFALMKSVSSLRLSSFSHLETYAYKDNDPLQLTRCGKSHPPHEAGDEMIWNFAKVLYHYNQDEYQAVLDDIVRVQQLIAGDFYTPEGLRADFTFHDHGPMLYMTGYGFGGYVWRAVYFDQFTSKLNDIVEPSGENKYFSLLEPGSNPHYLMTEYAYRFLGHQFYDDKLDFNAAGRGVAFANFDDQKFGQDISWGARRTYEYMGEIDPGRKAFYEHIALQNPPSAPAQFQDFHAHSWDSDYLLHRSENYFFSVRMSSSRVARQERSDDGVNDKNRFTSLGATNISLDQSHHYRLHPNPSFDWNYYPGVTAFHTPVLKSLGPWASNTFNQSGFVGGVNAGGCVVSAMDVDDILSGYDQMAPEFLKIKKSWFCFPDKVICLGSDLIWNVYHDPVAYTSVEQCNAVGTVRYRTAGNTTVNSFSNGSSTIADMKSVWHDGIEYQFLDPKEVFLGNVAGDPERIFKLYVDHSWFPGASPSRNEYAYAIVPNVSSTDYNNGNTQLNVDVLQKDEHLHAVYDHSSDNLQAVFFSAGTLDLGGGDFIKVDAPCILMVQGWSHTAEKTLSVSDPNQTLSELKVAFQKAGWYEQSQFHLPSGVYAGQTVNRSYFKTANGTNDIIYPVMDAHVQDGNRAEVEFGTANKLVVKNDGPGFNREAYLKFNLHQIPLTYEGRVELRLKLFGSGGPVEDFALMKVADDNWTEDIINDANKPAHLAPVVAQAKGQNGEYVQFDLTDLVREEMAGDGVLSLKLVSLSNNGVNGGYYEFASKEFAGVQERPRLVLHAPTVVLDAVEDAYVQKDQPERKFGIDHQTELKVKAHDYREVFLRFDLGNVTITDQNRAVLKMYCTHLDGVSSRNQISRVLNGNWDENTLHYANRPVSGSNNGDYQTVSGTGFVEFDVSEILFQAVREGETTLDLKIRSDQNVYQVFASSEGPVAWRPRILLGNFPSISSCNDQVLENRINDCQPDCYAPVADVYVSDYTPSPNSALNPGLNLLDCTPASIWVAEAAPYAYDYALFELEGPQSITGAEIAFFQGNSRTNAFYLSL